MFMKFELKNKKVTTQNFIVKQIMNAIGDVNYKYYYASYSE